MKVTSKYFFVLRAHKPEKLVRLPAAVWAKKNVLLNQTCLQPLDGAVTLQPPPEVNLIKMVDHEM